MCERVSAIIPVHNGERFLGEALRSVLAQTRPPDEIVVADDGSTDGTGASVAALAPGAAVPIRYAHQQNQGPAAARNLGVQQSDGDMLAFLDADDLWEPERIALQLERLDADPACEAVLGQVVNFLSPELDEAERRSLAQSAQQHGAMHIGALLIRRRAFLRVGCFDTRWRHGDFIEWWARATRLHLVYTVVPRLVLRRRIHGHNMTRREPDGRRAYLALLREQIALRRA